MKGSRGKGGSAPLKKMVPYQKGIIYERPEKPLDTGGTIW